MNRRSNDSINKWRAVALAIAVLGAAVLMIAEPVPQAGGGAPGLQEKLAAVKQSAAENQQKLHGYQWIETTQITLKGDAKPGTQSACKYGPDGKVQKTPMGAPQPQAAPAPSGGRLKQKVIAKKKEEFKDYGEDIKKTLALYVPPDPQKMQAAFQNKKVSMTADGLVFTDYALPGDQMAISFDSATKKMSALNVKTYMDDPKDAVTLAVTFASLPDGTNYVQQTVMNGASKQLQVTTTSSNYTPMGQ